MVFTASVYEHSTFWPDAAENFEAAWNKIQQLDDGFLDAINAGVIHNPKGWSKQNVQSLLERLRYVSLSTSCSMQQDDSQAIPTRRWFFCRYLNTTIARVDNALHESALAEQLLACTESHKTIAEGRIALYLNRDDALHILCGITDACSTADTKHKDAETLLACQLGTKDNTGQRNPAWLLPNTFTAATKQDQATMLIQQASRGGYVSTRSQVVQLAQLPH